MEKKMFCYQREQTDTAKLQDELTGALIGLARATESNPATQNTYQTIIEGLFTTITNVSFDGDSIREMIRRVQEEKAAIVPDCRGCGAPL